MTRMTLVAATALFAISGVVPTSIQAQSTDAHPIVGIWNLNLDKSTFHPGPGPRAVTRQFGVDDEGFLVSVRITVTGNGTPTFAMARVKIDGQGYPVWTNGAVYGFLAEGATPGGGASFEAVDARTLRLTQRNAAGEVNPLSPNTWAVSADGSTLTVTTMGTNPAGDTVHNVEVFDRVNN